MSHVKKIMTVLAGASSTPHSQGETRGYNTAGQGGSHSNMIDRYDFASDGDTTDVGNLTVGRDNPGGSSSLISGYTHGGEEPWPTGASNIIDKFAFASEGNATDVGNLYYETELCGGSMSTTHGYCFGGNGVNVIQKYSHSTDAYSTDVGDLTQGKRAGCTGSMSDTNSYMMGSDNYTTDKIERMAYASDGNSVDVANLTTARGADGHSSVTHGYATSGDSNIISKFAFASESDATDVGDQSVAAIKTSAQSSTTHGWSAGGYISGVGRRSDIERFAFASDGNSVTAGSMTGTRGTGAGNQNISGCQI